MKKLYLYFAALFSTAVSSQSILNEAETSSRIVSDPQAVVLAQGFHANSNVSNPFIAKIGASSETPSNPANSDAGSSNPSGPAGNTNLKFHDTKGNIDVTGSGQLQYTLAIALPPGIKGVAPQINLVYTSGSGNGIAGYGWSISGVTAITRMGRTIEKDGEVKGIQLDYSDYYSFNGQRLILKSGEYGKDGAEYVTEKYSNIKIKSRGEINQNYSLYKGPAFWEITFEDGSTAEYGSYIPYGTPAMYNATTPIEYNIKKWKDAQGNSIIYNYKRNPGSVTVISSIEWGGNETLNKPSLNEIIFNYNNGQQRSINEQAYAISASFIQNNLLNDITVKTNGLQFKKYEITYKKSETNYDFVDFITEKNSENESANYVKFDYIKTESSWKRYPFSDNSNNKIFGDYDGDGKVDFLKYYDAYTECGQYSTETTTDEYGNSYENSVCIRWDNKPAGVVLFKSFLENKPSIKVSNPDNLVILKSDLNNAVAVNFKDINNKTYSRQGFATYSKIKNSSTNKYDLKIQTYSISSDNVLKLEMTKTIPNDLYDRTISDYGLKNVPPDDGGDSYSIDTSIEGFSEMDVNADGISEILFTLKDETVNTYQGSTTYSISWRYGVIDMSNLLTAQQSYSDVYSYSDPRSNKFGDFNGDGKIDIIKFTNNVPKVYEFKRDSSTLQYSMIVTSFNPSNISLQGLVNECLFGDFNGDGKTDIILPNAQDSFNWNLYISSGNTFINKVLPPLSYFKKYDQIPHNNSSHLEAYSRSYAVQDINQDGKSDFITISTKIEGSPTNAHMYGVINYWENQGVDQDGNIKLQEKNIDGHSKTTISAYVPGTYPFGYTDPITGSKVSSYPDFNGLFYWGGKPEGFSLLTGNFRIDSYNSQLLVFIDSGFSRFSSYSVKQDSQIKSILQGNLLTTIDYKELDPSINSGLYASVKTEQYPYMEMDKVSQSYVVSQLRQENRKQDFKYRGFLTHLQGKGIIGFRQTARSSWYVDGKENTILWSAAEIDPLNDGLPIKEWTVKTPNDNSLIFNTSPNDALKSLKITSYITKKLLNGISVSSFSDADKPKIVTAIVPKSTISQDYVKNVKTESQIIYDFEDSNIPQSNHFYLPVKTIFDINDGFATSQTEMSYSHNTSGIGKDYYVGRPKTKIESSTAYSDSRSSEETYTYDNNLLSLLIKNPTGSRGSIEESYKYDGWGNVTEKTTTYKKVKINTPPSMIQTEKATYDERGRFVIKKTDNLGLESNIAYNDWGQIRSQTDPLGVSITNDYDKWGKLLSTVTDVGGVKMYTKHTYEKLDNGGSIVTQYNPDGSSTSQYTNKLGQEYKTRTKALGQNNYVAKYKVYDGLGRVTQESEPYFDNTGGVTSPGSGAKWNTIFYDDNYFPSKITATSFNGKQMETTFVGKTTTIIEVNGNKRTTSKTTDALGNVISSTDKGGSINFSYNAAGQQIKAQYDSNIVTTGYDEWGRKIEFNDPSNGIYKYEYDGFGRILREESPKGYKEYNYNNFGQLAILTEISNDGTSTNKNISYSYNAKGLVTGKTGTANGKAYNSSISYDTYGRVTSSSESSNGKYFIKKGITYDDKMRVASYEKSLYSSGQYTKVIIENVYDSSSGILYQVKDKAQNKVLWELQNTEADGRILSAKLGGTTIVNTYDNSNFIATTTQSKSSNNTMFLKMSYTFDALKNELTYRKREGGLGIEEYFDYDDNNRLKNWTDPVTGIKPQDIRNIYDIKGRIINNDQIGEIKFANNNKAYQATGMVLNTVGQQNFTENLLQKITYNENNDPIFIDGLKGDVAFTYGLTSMRQTATYGGNFAKDGTGKYTKYYSEDGSYEIVRNNQTGQEKHVLYIGGTPYDSNITFVKESWDNGFYYYLHKDYLGSILAVTSEDGNTVEQRHYDAWGNFTHLKLGNQVPIVGVQQVTNYLANNTLLIDRGYTSHEHFSEVGLIHMNGRLYDPLLRRFLNADENIQDMFNTQNYNKYGYVLNNPLLYNDPNGEFFQFLIPVFIWLASNAAAIGTGALIGAAIGAGMYLAQGLISGNLSWGGFAKAAFIGGLTGAVSGGLGQVFSASGFWAAVGNGALAGAGSGGVTSLINGTNFLEGVLKGAVIGGAVAGVSFTINYYANGYNKPRYTTTDDIAIDGSQNTEADLSTMQQNVKDARSNFTPEEISSYKIKSETIGLSDSNGLMLNSTDGKFNVLGETKLTFGSGKSTIAYSTKAASNPQILGRVMSHETAHAYSFALGLPNIEIDAARRLDSSLDSVEHIAIRKLEHVYANKNYILSNYWKNGYMDMDVINMTLKALRPNELFLYNYSYNKFFSIFNRTFKFR